MVVFIAAEGRDLETASHAGHCPINLVNVRYIETELHTKYMGSRTTVMKIGQNV